MARRTAIINPETDGYFFVDNQAFHKSDANRLLRFELIEGVHTNPNVRCSSKISNNFMMDLSDYPILNREGERGIFLKYNYAKCKYNRLRIKLSPKAAPLRKLADIIKDTRDQIALRNIRLVSTLVGQRVGQRDRQNPLVFEELRSYAFVPLMKSIERFNVAFGNKFSTYLSWGVKNEIIHHYNVLNIGNNTTTNHGEFETTDHRAAELLSFEVVSHVDEYLKSLCSSREKEVLRLRFGLHDGRPWSLNEIGKLLDISKERARQIQNDAIQRIRYRFGIVA